MFNFKKNNEEKLLRTLIIDDEEHQRISIGKMVRTYCPEATVVGTADGVKSGIEAITLHKPDLVLLDIKMDDGTGFDLLDRLHHIDFKVIFITAFEQYAVKAFRMSAIDYLLKPLDPDELREAVEKVRSVARQYFQQQLDNLKDLLSPGDKSIRKIILKTAENIYLVPVHEISHCESDGTYTNLYLADQSRIMVSNSLKEYEELLSDNGFFRVHRSYLINLRKIRRFEKAEGGYVILDEEIRIPVASRKREQLLELFEKLTGL